MVGFEFLPHTDTVRLKIWGKQLEELFRNALRGVSFYLKSAVFEQKKKSLKGRHEIKIEAVDLPSLLIEFLSEVITQSDIHNKVFTDVVFKEFGENFLTGELTGSTVDGFDKEIKAVSYQDIDVKRNPETGMYETVLVLDV